MGQKICEYRNFAEIHDLNIGGKFVFIKVFEKWWCHISNYLPPGYSVCAWKYETLTFVHGPRNLGPYKKIGLPLSLYRLSSPVSK